MLEKIKQLCVAFRQEAATLIGQINRDDITPDRKRHLEAQLDVVRRHVIHLDGVIESEAADWAAFLKEIS